MHRAAAWQHRSNSNIKIVHSSIEHFMWNPYPWEVMPEVFKCSVRKMRWVVCSRNEVPPHFSNRTLEYLRHNFPWDRFILHQTDNPWPSYSQDLNPPDYLLSGYLKDRICENNPQTREDIIRKEICRIPFYNFINVQYLWRKNLEGFLMFVKVIAKEE